MEYSTKQKFIMINYSYLLRKLIYVTRDSSNLMLFFLIEFSEPFLFM